MGLILDPSAAAPLCEPVVWLGFAEEDLLTQFHPSGKNGIVPHLLPLAKSESSGNVVCALRRAYADDADYDSLSLAAPWPIVESTVGTPGMRLLSLNSEHLMRRIASETRRNA